MWYLLGVMHGHWERPVDDEDAVVTDGPSPEYVNMGIAVVTPIAAVLGLFQSGPLRASVDEFARFIEQRQEADLPVMDTAGTASMGEGEFERFENLTRRILSVPKQEIDEERKTGDS